MSAAPARVWEQIRQGRAPTESSVDAAVDPLVLGETGAARARDDLRAQVLGLGPLEDVVADPAVTDVLVNGVDGCWADRGRGLELLAVTFEDHAAVRRLAVRLAGLAGQRLDEARPFVDGLLPGGIRLHAVLPPLSCDGVHLSLRVPRRQAPDLPTLGAWGMFEADGEDLLRALVAARVAFVVSGGTGTGKTTLLGAMLREVDPGERVVVVEDVREIPVMHPHVVRLQGRGPNVEGAGAVTLTDLVRQSLRMRPDRVVVGEVRGAEVRELLTALNTGHEGGCGTLHANTTADVVSRFEALGALAGLSLDAVHAQLASAVRVVVHLDRANGPRRVREIAVLLADRGRVRAEPAWRCRPGEATGPAVADLTLPGRSLLDGLLGRTSTPGGGSR